ncbi:hypothetical protein [Pseudomonas aeruginosa]|uniref:hypothetical protein n=1 Tax=Pseudomonas aeruginosa TaxID=287 RepID=UPI00397B745A
MSVAELLELAQAEGVSLALEDGRLIWEADREPPEELLEEIRSCRLGIIEELARDWLGRVARLLGCTPEHLLEHRFIDHHDLVEQHQQAPWRVARLIQTHPDWSPSSQGPYSDTAWQDDGTQYLGLALR